MTKKKKIIFGMIIIALGVGGYFGYKAMASKDSNKISYTSSAVEKGTIVVSVSGTGQVLSLDEVDIKSGASGDVTFLGMENGKTVSKGALLAKIDTTSLEKEISDAQTTLEQAQLTLDKMNGMTTSQGALRGVKEKATDSLAKSYENGFNSVSDIFLNLPSVMSGLSDILFSYDFVTSQWNIGYYSNATKMYGFGDDIAVKSEAYSVDAYNKYQIARKAYDQNFQDYKLTSRSSSEQTVESLIEETYQTTKDIAEAVKSANNLIQFYQDELTIGNLKPQALSTTHLSSLSSYASKTNGYLSTLLSSSDSIKTSRESLIETGFDIKDQETKVAQAQTALDDLQEKFADYSVTAPFSGIIAQTNIKRGDSVSSGTALASIITKQKVVEISLNEVDASKVKIGQKATLTFDAIDNLSITGSVIEIDSLGTVSQGVVTYNTKISLNSQDERVKTGMSVSASIVVDVKQDVLMVPNAAIKNQNDTNYVEIMDATSSTPQSRQVVIGIADDSFTEIVSGLSVGEKVVTKTIDNTSKTAQTATANILNVGEGASRNSGQMGGGFR